MLYCSACGTANDDNAFRCTACGAVLQRVPPVGSAPFPGGGGQAGWGGQGSVGPGPAKANLAQSIIVAIFCCQILGIIAIVYSALAMGQNSAGNYPLAHQYAKKANTWAWIGFGIGLVILVFYGISIAINAATPSHPGRP